MRRRSTLLLLTLLSVVPVSLAACFSPDYGDGGAACVASHECNVKASNLLTLEGPL